MGYTVLVDQTGFNLCHGPLTTVLKNVTVQCVTIIVQRSLQRYPLTISTVRPQPKTAVCPAYISWTVPVPTQIGTVR